MKKLALLTLIGTASAQDATQYPYIIPATQPGYQAAQLAIAQQQLAIQRQMAQELRHARWKAEMEELTRPITINPITHLAE